MKRSISLWQFIGFVVTSLFGVLLHFLYQWTNECVFVAPFSSVNESTWEHLKLLFFPMFIFALFQQRIFLSYQNFWCVKRIGIVTGLILVPVLFYTLQGMFGPYPDWINIAIFFVVVVFVYVLETLLFKNNCLNGSSFWLCTVVLCLIALLFALFTFVTPQIPLFEDPISGTYGIHR